MTDQNGDGEPSPLPEPTVGSEDPGSPAAPEMPPPLPAATASPPSSNAPGAAPAPAPGTPRPSGKTIGAVGVLGALVLAALFCFAPDLVPTLGLDPPSLAARTSGIATVRAAAVAAAVGLAAILTLLLSLRTARTTEYNAQLVREAQQDARDDAARRDATSRESLELTRQAQRDAREDAERRDQTTRQSLELTRQSLTQTRAGQLTEAYTAAIELLGAHRTAADRDQGDQAAVMSALGGVYALERLARAEPETYRPTVVEVLSAFVRAHTGLQGLETAGALYLGWHDAEGNPEANEPPLPAHDAAVLAALSVLGRLADPAPTDPAGDGEPVPFDQARQDYLTQVQDGALRADLRRCNLRGVSLIGLDLRGARLDGSDLRGAVLRGTDLRFAHFDQCDLTNARLPFAQISGASFNDAWLVGTCLDAVRAGPAAAPQEATHFGGAHLERATFDGADLRGCRFYDADGLARDQFLNAFGNRTTRGLEPRIQAPSTWAPR